MGMKTIPSAVAPRPANLEGLTRAQTTHTHHHRLFQVSQTLTLSAVKMAAATAAEVASTLAVTRLKKLLPKASIGRIVESMMRTRTIGM